MNSAIFVTLIFAVATVSAGSVEFTPCNSQNLAIVDRFEVSDCPDGSTHCTFVKGNTYTFAITGRSHSNAPVINNLYYKVVAVILGIPVTLLQGNACESTACPINPGEAIQYTIDRLISSSAPTVSNVPVEASISLNENGSNPIACAGIRASIQNALLTPAEPKQIVHHAKVSQVE